MILKREKYLALINSSLDTSIAILPICPNSRLPIELNMHRLVRREKLAIIIKRIMRYPLLSGLQLSQ